MPPMRTASVTTWHLELTSFQALRAARHPQEPCVVARLEPSQPAFSRFLYASVGADWWWIDRLPWTLADWRGHLERPEVATWVLYVGGAPAGYVELERQSGGNVELLYFGLLPGFSGRGFGGHLLTVGVEEAFALGARRVWVHTCSLDGPGALPNYQARGFSVFKVVTHEQALPEAPLELWPGAGR
ncbi:MAG: GNAT family N-acetyltransferase [Deltaproteobacteria bacterium]|nr:GNAT family N-acetyltransferase [Deltaproteobacteria bacterium]